jgi:hypothetical protein
MMRFTTYLLSLLLAFLLASCGGGGGSPGLVQGIPLTTTAGANVTLAVGSTYQFSVRGGVSPYFVRNGNPDIAVGWVDGDRLTIGTVNGGAATIQVVDFRGTSVEIVVTAGSSIPFYTTAPTSLTIAPGVTGSRTFKMGGGAGPYTATSSSGAIAVVSQNGSDWTVTGVATGDASIILRDATGKTITVAVTVKAAVDLTVSLTNATVFLDDEVLVEVSGGTPPYRTTIGIPDAASYTVENGNLFRFKMLRLVDPLEVTIFDSQNQSKKITLKVILGTNAIRLSPSTVVTSESDTQPVYLNVYGAAPTGTKYVFSSDPRLLQATVSGNIVTVNTGTAGTRCITGSGAPPARADQNVTITLIDSKGATGTATITVLDNNGGVAAGC